MESDILQLKNKLVGALWWTNCVMEKMCSYELKRFVGISVLQFQNMLVRC